MHLQKILVILGPPGSGKGTQSKLLIEKLGYAYFSMGDTLREYAKKGTDLGRKIKEIIDQGLIVSDDLAKQVVEESWTEFLEKPGLILEGYPRTDGQIEVLDEFMSKHEVRDLKVLSIQVDKQKLLNRILLRSKVESRVDDADTAAVEKRFVEYENKTAKVIDYYKQKGNLTQINGDQSIGAVHGEILSRLEII